MQRREFLTVLSGAAAWSLGAQAQQPAVRVIGLLSSASSHDYGPMIATFRKALSETGFIEGQNVRIEYRWADEHYDRLPALANELVRDQVALILAASTPAALAVKTVTKTIPIVFAIGGDPVRTGLVESLSHPGGNITGAAHINVETAPKRLELLHELLPSLQIVGLLINPTNPLARPVEEGVQTAASSLGLKLQVLHARTDEEIDAAFASLPELGALSLGSKIPAIYQYRTFTAAGGVMSYGGNITDSYYHAGLYAGRILKGEKPADLPVQLSTKVELFLNLKSVEALGIKPPLSLLGRADEVIE
jgi:putative tryptophan/tyrosine transport system substrate-binding protein